MEAPHWICKVMAAVSDPAFYDGLIAGIAVACIPFIFWLFISGN